MKYNRTNKKHEDNLKFELAKGCARSGIMLHFEYRYGDCRFDAVVVRGDDILAIIEVKNWAGQVEAHKKTQKPSKQLAKYVQFGVPVYVLWFYTGIGPLIKRLNTITRRFDERGRPEKYKNPVDYFPLIVKKPTKKGNCKKGLRKPQQKRVIPEVHRVKRPDVRPVNGHF